MPRQRVSTLDRELDATAEGINFRQRVKSDATESSFRQRVTGTGGGGQLLHRK